MVPRRSGWVKLPAPHHTHRQVLERTPTPRAMSGPSPGRRSPSVPGPLRSVHLFRSCLTYRTPGGHLWSFTMTPGQVRRRRRESVLNLSRRAKSASTWSALPGLFWSEPVGAVERRSPWTALANPAIPEGVRPRAGRVRLVVRSVSGRRGHVGRQSPDYAHLGWWCDDLARPAPRYDGSPAHPAVCPRP